MNRELACLKKMCSNLVADAVLTSNPARFVDFLTEENEPGRVLNKEEELHYLSCASQPLRDYAILLVETGVRPAELCRLATQDVCIDMEKPYLIVKDGKTRAARRSVPLSSRALEILTKRLNNAKGKFIFPEEEAATIRVPP